MMRLITVQERLSADRNKDTICVLGPFGVGKTSLLYTLPPEDTLCVNFEMGMKSVQTWTGDMLEPQTLGDMLDIATLVGGPKEGLRPNEDMGIEHYNYLIREKYKGFDIRRYRRIFTDSITRMTESAWDYARTLPSSMVLNKQGQLVDDTRGTYGEMGRVVVALLKHMQRAPGVDIIFVGLLARGEDTLHRVTYEPQMMGQMAARELPGIVDHVVSMVLMDYSPESGWSLNWDNGQHRAFVCRRINPWGLPAKSRAEEFIDVIEEPNLGKLLEKINQPARAGLERLSTARPDEPNPLPA